MTTAIDTTDASGAEMAPLFRVGQRVSWAWGGHRLGRVDKVLYVPQDGLVWVIDGPAGGGATLAKGFNYIVALDDGYAVQLHEDTMVVAPKEAT